jgi:hypothetical protein
MLRQGVTVSEPKSLSYTSTEAMIFFALVSSIGVARPVKVENACLLKAPQ